MASEKDNPYLAHRYPSGKSKSAANAVSIAAGIKEPLFGFMPRKVTGPQVRKALVRSSMCYRATFLHSVLMTFFLTGT